MTNQGFTGALIQYFTIEDKPRLTRRNTWFRDHGISEDTTILFCMYLMGIVMTIFFYQMMGLLP